MPKSANPIPPGFHSVTPYLILNDANKAIDFYQKAFGAQKIMSMPGPGGKVGHAEIKIGDSIIMLSDEMPGGTMRSPKSLGNSTVGIFVYVNDVDKVYKQAVDAGAKAEMPPADMFWGDRFGKLVDPFGHSWNLATHVEDVEPAEMERRAKAAMTQAAGQATT